MKQCKPCIQNDNNNNNIIIIIKWKKKSKGRERALGEESLERKIFYFFFLFAFFFFSDLRKLDCRFSSGLKAKLIIRRELRMGTKILEFRQIPRSKIFSYLCYL